MKGLSFKFSLLKTALCAALLFALCVLVAPDALNITGLKVYADSFSGYGAAQYRVAPPSGANVNGMFNLVRNASYDPNYGNVVILTYEAEWKSGAAWSKQKLDLSRPFAIETYVQLYHKQGFITNTENDHYRNGGLADGLTFTLQNDNAYAINNSTAGGLLGVYGSINGGDHIKKALTIEMDTRPQTSVDTGTGMVDPSSGQMAHISVLTPKSAWIYPEDHKNTEFFTATDKWYPLNINWTPVGDGGVLSYQFDGRNYSYYISSCYAQFGAKEAYWGFTAATGWGTAVQAVAMKTFPAQQPVTVTYYPNEGVGSVKTDSVYPNTYYTVVSQGYTRSGYTFNGWNTNPYGTGVNYANGQQIYVTGNITLYARWAALPTAAITYYPNGGSGSPYVVNANMNTYYTVVNQGYTKNGSVFSGWNTKADGTGTAYQNGQSIYVTSNVSLYAQWLTQNIYLAIYMPNDGVGNIVIDMTDDRMQVTVRGAIYTRSGYTFNGWNTLPNGTGIAYAAGQTVTLNDNVFLYAQWKSVAPSYSVVYMANGGQGGSTDSGITAGSRYTVKTATAAGVINQGKYLLQWNTQANGGGAAYAAGTSLTVNGNITLYAIWVSYV